MTRCCTLKIRGGQERDRYGKKAGKGALIQWDKSGTLGVSQDQTLFVWSTPYRGGGNTSRTSHGSGWNENISFTLNSVDVHGVVYEIHNDGASPKRFKDKDR